MVAEGRSGRLRKKISEFDDRQASNKSEADYFLMKLEAPRCASAKIHAVGLHRRDGRVASFGMVCAIAYFGMASGSPRGVFLVSIRESLGLILLYLPSVDSRSAQAEFQDLPVPDP